MDIISWIKTTLSKYSSNNTHDKNAIYFVKNEDGKTGKIISDEIVYGNGGGANGVVVESPNQPTEGESVWVNPDEDPEEVAVYNRSQVDALHQSIVNSITSLSEAGYLFSGVATSETNPGTPDAKVFYIANGKGTYEKFGGLEVTEDDVVVFYYDTAWHKVSTGIASNQKLTELERNLSFTQKEVIVSEKNILTSATGMKYLQSAFYNLPTLFKIFIKAQYNGRLRLYYTGNVLIKDISSIDLTYGAVVSVDIPAQIDHTQIGVRLDVTSATELIEVTAYTESIDYLGKTKILGNDPLLGKKWCVCGDSFTWGDMGHFTHEWQEGYQLFPDEIILEEGKYKGMRANYGHIIGNRYNMNIVMNAASGACMANNNFSVNDPNAEISYRKIPFDSDYITIAFGLNEIKDKTEMKYEIGDESSVGSFSIWGAYNRVFEYIKTNIPNAKVGVILMDGWMTEAYRTLCKRICQYWGIEVLDMFEHINSCLVLPLSGSVYDNMSPKAIELQNRKFNAGNDHPSRTAQYARANLIAEWLKQL